MKSNIFAKLLKAHTANASYVTTSEDSWAVSGIAQVPNNISSKIGNIVALLQAKVEQGYWCTENECLMVYDLEVLDLSEQNCLCTLSIIIKPIDQINNLNNSIGENLQLVINGNTGEIGNDTYGLAQMGLFDEEDLEEPSIVYGNYKECLSSEENYLTGLFVKEDIYAHKNSKVEATLSAGAPLYFSFRPMKSFDFENTIDYTKPAKTVDGFVNAITYSKLKSGCVV